MLFSIGSIWRANGCAGSRFAGFPFSHLCSHRIERPRRGPAAKMTRKAISEVSTGFAADRGSQPQRPVQHRKCRDCRNPYFSGSKCYLDEHRQQAMCLSIVRSSELNLLQQRFPKSSEGRLRTRPRNRAQRGTMGRLAQARNTKGRVASRAHLRRARDKIGGRDVAASASRRASITSINYLN
jgi:hypothetical protein